MRGCVAIERGPEVLALESVDLESLGVGDVEEIFVAPDVFPVERDGHTWVRVAVLDHGDRLWPYGTVSPADPIVRTGEVRLVPYHDWAERGPSTMRIWIPTM